MKALLLLAALALPSFANAVDTRIIETIESGFNVCSNHANSTHEMLECAANGYKRADAQLNSVYREIVNPLQGKADSDSVETLSRLKAAQVAWIKFRDAECSFVGAENLGGSLERVSTNGCLVRMTIQRVKELTNVITGGDHKERE